MKKSILFIALAIVTLNTAVLAQSRDTGTPAVENVKIFSIKLNDGENTIRIPDGRGAIKLVKRGDTFSSVTFTDANGKVYRLMPSWEAGGQAPEPECECPMPDACYSIPDNQQFGMCICKPCEISSGEYSVSLLLPAVQSAREAARRTSTSN